MKNMIIVVLICILVVFGFKYNRLKTVKDFYKKALWQEIIFEDDFIKILNKVGNLPDKAYDDIRENQNIKKNAVKKFEISVKEIKDVK